MPAAERIALVSDIHGNLPALEAVLEDTRRRGVTRIVNLGDSLSGPLLPLETARFLMSRDWVQLAGNHERQLLEFAEHGGGESDAYAHAQLTPDVFEWMRALTHARPRRCLPQVGPCCEGRQPTDELHRIHLQ